jgi:hypothetical protein
MQNQICIFRNGISIKTLEMSGIEVVGIVFGAIPLFVEFGRAAATNADAARRAVRSRHRNDQLREFYISFYKETVLLHQQTELIIDSLPLLSINRKNDVKAGRHIDNWTKETDISLALDQFFTTEDLAAFDLLMERLLELFSRLIKDGRVHLSQTDKVSIASRTRSNHD